jgi:hypothetical protein
MTGAMMWGSGAALQSTCRQWATAGASSAGSPSWCDEMIGWMEQHIDNWNNWMMHGGMMGG